MAEQKIAMVETKCRLRLGSTAWGTKAALLGLCSPGLTKTRSHKSLQNITEKSSLPINCIHAADQFSISVNSQIQSRSIPTSTQSLSTTTSPALYNTQNASLPNPVTPPKLATHLHPLSNPLSPKSNTPTTKPPRCSCNPAMYRPSDTCSRPDAA